MFLYILENHRSRIRSSRPDVFCKKGVLRNFAKFIGKHLCQSLFLNKVAGPRHRCFPVNFAKFLRTPLITEHLQTTASAEFIFSNSKIANHDSTKFAVYHVPFPLNV